MKKALTTGVLAALLLSGCANAPTYPDYWIDCASNMEKHKDSMPADWRVWVTETSFDQPNVTIQKTDGNQEFRMRLYTTKKAEPKVSYQYTVIESHDNQKEVQTMMITSADPNEFVGH